MVDTMFKIKMTCQMLIQMIFVTFVNDLCPRQKIQLYKNRIHVDTV